VIVELFGPRLTIGCAVAEFYCFDYSTADNDPNAWWIPGGYWETMADQSSSCARQYVIVDRVTFSSMAQGYQAGGSSSSAPNPDVLSAISVMFGLVLTAMAAIWGLKRLYRLLTFRESSD